ncbi:hypothetical protein WS68_23305 [Burkholderia sp. TSV86]|nr:hypothetical protein WS68_23305 [Burkholderia sp. TSV86]
MFAQVVIPTCFARSPSAATFGRFSALQVTHMTDIGTSASSSISSISTSAGEIMTPERTESCRARDARNTLEHCAMVVV